MNLISCQNNDELSSKATALLITKINETIARKGTCVLAIPGGRSVADLLQKLSPTDVDWSKVEIFMIDERVVSIDDTES
ncbi:MAG: 6-phosphogluconolactonase, partial [Nanoarchaeota archaeon]|nr:6-phosphogluconolactonase [Nanoarchaeota archaeon]